ncbi:hypothetical protein LTR95_007095 [Oleoguttula sp. CCFEE 5521]
MTDPSDGPDSLVRAQRSEEDVGSADTTLLASPASSRAQSPVDKAARWHQDRSQDHGHDSDSDDGEDGADTEGEHLLAHDTARLNRTAAATDLQADEGEPPGPPQKAKPVSWSSLPKKTQLAILTLSRLSEPLTQTSLQSYMFYQLKSFTDANGNAPSDSTVARQAGMLAAAFTFAQFLTAIMWGRLADSEMFGRKRVILIGLLGTCIGSLGFGFSKSFATAMFWRAVGGMLNGNMGVMRTMISEIVKEKKYQSRAFLLLPMTFNIGVIIGPLLGGLLADPVGSYPYLFGPGGSVGGKEGVRWLMTFPYALPNVVNAGFLFGSAMGVTFGLEETLEALKGKPDYPLRFSRWILRTILRRRPVQEYSALGDSDDSNEDMELRAGAKVEKPQIKRKLPLRRIWTRNVLLTLLSHGLLAMHVGTFNNLWFVFLSTPRYNANPAPSQKSTLQLPENYRPHLPFTFTGGLALPPRSIGTALAIMGFIGITMQLLLYPRVSFRLGTTTSLRYSFLLFPIAYFIVPFLAVVPSTLAAPGQASGALIWVCITLVLLVQVTARTFALPSTTILVNNCCPHPSVLGTIHGIAQSVSSATRTVGPVLAGWIYGVGLNKGIVGMAWWGMCIIAVMGAIAGQWVKEGDGHEIWLEGEEKRSEDDAG